ALPSAPTRPVSGATLNYADKNLVTASQSSCEPIQMLFSPTDQAADAKVQLLLTFRSSLTVAKNPSDDAGEHPWFANPCSADLLAVQMNFKREHSARKQAERQN